MEKLTFAHKSGHLGTLFGLYNLQSNPCTNGRTNAIKSIQPFFQSEMLVFEHVFKSRYPSPAIKTLHVRPKQDPSPRMPLPTRTQLERGDKKGMQGSLALHHITEGRRKCNKGGDREDRGERKSLNWRPIAFISTDCKMYLFFTSPINSFTSSV